MHFAALTKGRSEYCSELHCGGWLAIRVQWSAEQPYEPGDGSFACPTPCSLLQCTAVKLQRVMRIFQLWDCEMYKVIRGVGHKALCTLNSLTEENEFKETLGFRFVSLVHGHCVCLPFPVLKRTIFSSLCILSSVHLCLRFLSTIHPCLSITGYFIVNSVSVSRGLPPISPFGGYIHNHQPRARLSSAFFSRSVGCLPAWFLHVSPWNSPNILGMSDQRSLLLSFLYTLSSSPWFLLYPLSCP